MELHLDPNHVYEVQGICGADQSGQFTQNRPVEKTTLV